MGVAIVHGKCHFIRLLLVLWALFTVCHINHTIHRIWTNTGDYLRGYPEGRSSSRYRRALYFEKLTAAQKRQNQRDYRRQFINPDRTQAEEYAEQQRKHHQGLFDPKDDPRNRQFGSHEYSYYREKNRAEQCKLTGRGCKYHALDWDPVDKKYDYDKMHGEHYWGTEFDNDVTNPGGNP